MKTDKESSDMSWHDTTAAALQYDKKKVKWISVGKYKKQTVEYVHRKNYAELIYAEVETEIMG